MAASTGGQILKKFDDDRKQQAKSHNRQQSSSSEIGSGEKKPPETGSGDRKIEPFSDEALEGLLDKLELHKNLDQFSDLLQAMTDNRLISIEETAQIMQGNEVVKCGLPEQVKPMDPENPTDAENCVDRLLSNDPTLKEINLNNMRRTPLPVLQKIIYALKDNTYLKKLSLANTGLSDSTAEAFLEILESNKALEALNLETNFLTGEFLVRLFTAALQCPTLYEIKCVNQSSALSTECEMKIMDVVAQNESLTKVSLNLRRNEAREKIDRTCSKNSEKKRQLRRLQSQNSTTQ